MALFKLRRDHPDGLDPIFEAHRFIKKVLDAAEMIDDYYVDENTGEEIPIGNDLRRVHGTGELVEMNDHNVLNALEKWIEEQMIDPEWKSED